jgi:NADPH-dependent 2,4-dienoyl-CoA reductase/sulfur reductase-like enzyme
MGEVELESTFLRPAARYAEQGIELQLGRRATAIVRADRRIDFAAGEPLHYDRLMLTTGGRPRRLDLPGADLPGIFYLRSIDDVLAMQPAMVAGARVTIVGGGFIGLEVAAAAARRGCRVTVLEVEDWLLKRVAPRLISDAFEALHRRYGVDIRLATAVIGFAGEGRLRQVATSDGARLDADLAVIGIGIVPNVELAAAAGLEIANGIVVDQFGRTSDPDIYAAGDAVAGHNPLLGRRLRLESWQNAQNQAIVFASEDQARTWVEGVRDDAVPACVRRNFTKAQKEDPDPGVEIDVTSAGTLPVADVGDESFGIRLTVDVTQAGRTTPVYLDYVFVRVGDAVSVLALINAGEPFDDTEQVSGTVRKEEAKIVTTGTVNVQGEKDRKVHK